MASKEEEYQEMFLAEALDNYEELNKLFTTLEKNTANKKVVDQIFRITHTLKGNAMGMGFIGIAELGHVMEDIFSEVKEGKIILDEELFNMLFKANDKLGELIDAIKTGKAVAYKGIRTKLMVYLKNAKEESGAVETPVEVPAVKSKTVDKKTEVTPPTEKINEMVPMEVSELPVPEMVEQIASTIHENITVPIIAEVLEEIEEVEEITSLL